MSARVLQLLHVPFSCHFFSTLIKGESRHREVCSLTGRLGSLLEKSPVLTSCEQSCLPHLALGKEDPKRKPCCLMRSSISSFRYLARCAGSVSVKNVNSTVSGWFCRGKGRCLTFAICLMSVAFLGGILQGFNLISCVGSCFSLHCIFKGRFSVTYKAVKSSFGNALQYFKLKCFYTKILARLFFINPPKKVHPDTSWVDFKTNLTWSSENVPFHPMKS